MQYPTKVAVEEADIYQLARWHRFLASPGESSIGKPGFNSVLEEQLLILNRIQERLKALGGITTEVSKAIGWDKP